MRPLSSHWADVAAFKVVQTRGDKDVYVVASGITPSGLIHIGNFREVVTVDLVARALMKIGKKVKFIYSWDNFDTFRKVPKNLPDPEAFEKYLRQPIARIPDPWGKEESYAAGRIKDFEEELKHVGISPLYLYQEKKYGAGEYAQEMRFALENKEGIRAILDRFRTTPLPAEWVPTSIYCHACQTDQIETQSYEGEWNYHYTCKNCGKDETVDIRTTRNMKLAWRIDWPMRWHFENVDFEPAGKDHSSQGGSYDTGIEILTKVWNKDPLVYLQYDFVMIKGGAGKMSSSSGELYTLSEVLEVYEPQITRWIFAQHRPNHDFALSFDEDVIKIYEEFDRSEELAYSEPPNNKGKWEINRRDYELSCFENPERDIPEKQPVRAAFRILCNRLQICGNNIERTFARYYEKDITDSLDKKRFMTRAHCAVKWLEKHASEEFRYTLHDKRVSMALEPEQEKAIACLRAFLEGCDLSSITTKELNDLLWKHAVHEAGCDPKLAFQGIYKKLIGRDQGPRLPSFLQEIGNERLLEIL